MEFRSKLAVVSLLLLIPEFEFMSYVVRCAIWHRLSNLKNVKNTHGVVLILVKLQAKASFYVKYRTTEKL